MTTLLTACGGDSGGGGGSAPAPIYSMALNTVAELPACDEDHEKQLVYIIETQQFQTCQAGTWTVIEIKGAPGEAGAAGAAGPAGPKGEKGAKGDPGEVTEAPEDYTFINNTLASINMGDTLATMLPEAKTLLLEKGELSNPTVGAATWDQYDLAKSNPGAGEGECVWHYYWTISILQSTDQVDIIYNACD